MVPLFFERFLLAQAAAPGGEPSPFGAFIYAFPILALLFYLMILRPQKRQEQTHKDMLKNLKENDRVVTIGGIHGVVTNVQRDAERVTIRVDESTGTKLKVGLSAIARVVTGDETEAGASGKSGAANKS